MKKVLPNLHIFSISKHFFSKIQGQLMPMTGAISGVVTPKDKTKSNCLARKKTRTFSKSGKFLIFPSVIKRRKFTLPNSYQDQSMEVKSTG